MYALDLEHGLPWHEVQVEVQSSLLPQRLQMVRRLQVQPERPKSSSNTDA